MVSLFYQTGITSVPVHSHIVFSFKTAVFLLAITESTFRVHENTISVFSLSTVTVDGVRLWGR